MKHVLAIFLDGYEHSLGLRLMSAGEMPEMSRLAESSAQFILNYGPAQRTGLAGEHVATGLSPEDAQRWSAIHFDPRSYQVWQEGTRLRPFAADLDARTIVFDTPYFDLGAAPAAKGIVGWGAHDSGVGLAARPASLLSELHTRFGRYPATQWIYGFAWPSSRKTSEMGQSLTRAVDVRADAAHWLLAERLPDWDLALVTVSESHSALEALWHGEDPSHPLHQLPSARAARTGIHAVYRAIDRLVGRLASAFPDAQTVVFSMGGMGENRSDLPSMVLLPELIYRQVFRARLFRQPLEWHWSGNGSPILLSDTDNWVNRLSEGFGPLLRHRMLHAGRAVKPVNKAQSLGWMPAAAYQPFWHVMPAFALPSYYDGRVRVNLKGRESCGVVKLDDYQRVLAKIERVVRESIDPVTRKSVVDFVEHTAPRDPRELAETQADLVFVWRGTFSALEHPSLGRIGPLPYRRTGGHTGASGIAYVRAHGMPVGEYGARSAFDVVPTLIDLLERPRPPLVSGTSLLHGSKIAAPKLQLGEQRHG